MNIQGYFTQDGLELAAKLNVGATLMITRVVASSGQTDEGASALSRPRQTLAVNTPTRSGIITTIPATLTAAQAEEDYTLTELGVYATDPDKGEILYRICRLDAPVDITAGSQMVLRFYLKETVRQDIDVTVVCSPNGLLTELDLAPVREPVLALAAFQESVTLTATELPAYIASLPRLLTRNLTITVSGTLTMPLIIQGFYGSGSLKIESSVFGDCKIQNTLVQIIDCNIFVQLDNLEFTDEGAAAGISNGATLTVDRAPLVWIVRCSFTGNGTGGAVMVTRHATATLENVVVQQYDTAISSWYGGISVLIAVSGENNAFGICTYNDGIAILAGSELLVGGAANYNNSGVIIRGGSMV